MLPPLPPSPACGPRLSAPEWFRRRSRKRSRTMTAGGGLFGSKKSLSLCAGSWYHSPASATDAGIQGPLRALPTRAGSEDPAWANGPSTDGRAPSTPGRGPRPDACPSTAEWAGAGRSSGPWGPRDPCRGRPVLSGSLSDAAESRTRQRV